jgi:hypothetical protein
LCVFSCAASAQLAGRPAAPGQTKLVILGDMLSWATKALTGIAGPATGGLRLPAVLLIGGNGPGCRCCWVQRFTTKAGPPNGYTSAMRGQRVLVKAGAAWRWKHWWNCCSFFCLKGAVSSASVGGMAFGRKPAGYQYSS